MLKNGSSSSHSAHFPSRFEFFEDVAKGNLTQELMRLPIGYAEAKTEARR